jgi:SAM-dependent methyltransferase
MAYSVRFPAQIAGFLDQTWRMDPLLLYSSGREYFDVHCSLIERHEPLKEVLRACLKEGDLVLEAGCGAGRWMSYLLRCGCRCVGVDVSDEILRLVKGRAPELSMTAGDVVALPLRASCCDAVLSSYVFEHFADGPVRPLAESWRVLKPGGVLIFVVPYDNLLRRLVVNPLLDLVIRCKRHGRRMEFVEYRFSRRECRRYLKSAGFVVERILPDDYVGGWTKGIAVDYLNMRVYMPELPALRNEFQLPSSAGPWVSLLRRISPWTCCGGVVCIARKPG